jgi:hypothetical protein
VWVIVSFGLPITNAQQGRPCSHHQHEQQRDSLLHHQVPVSASGSQVMAIRPLMRNGLGGFKFW